MKGGPDVLAKVADYVPALPDTGKLTDQFWSTIIGAVVGGLIALSIQLLNYRYIRKQELATQRKYDLTNAISMLLKAAKMFTSIRNIDDHMIRVTHLAKSYPDKPFPIWEILQPLIGNTAEVLFSDDERMLAVKGFPKNFIDILQITDIHNGLISLVDEYSSLRIELGSLMPVVAHDNNQATTNLTEEDLRRLTPRMLNLQSLIGPMIEQSALARKDSIAVFELIKTYGQKEFGMSFPKLELNEG